MAKIYVLETQGRTIVAGQIVELRQGLIDNISARLKRDDWYIPTFGKNEGQTAVSLKVNKSGGVSTELVFPPEVAERRKEEAKAQAKRAKDKRDAQAARDRAIKQQNAQAEAMKSRTASGNKTAKETKTDKDE